MMSPTELQEIPITEHSAPAVNGQAAAPAAPAAVQASQPRLSEPMDPQRPHVDTDAGLRGGDRGGMCPGRFCFIIPCPIPCDCCII
ncbi:hypothetical protein VM1G_10507 [Cytospora mali]|uniref:Uncharacterized protein n=1 Tax=Cytospora mali TaxID=578113 RepID=A0A194VHX3_CYTMA|nr:hypothetical protein VM1G_10507 [Valsa mali]